MKKALSIFLTFAMLFGMFSAAGIKFAFPASAAGSEVNLAAGRSYTYRTFDHQDINKEGYPCYNASVNKEITITPPPEDPIELLLYKGFDDNYFHSKKCSDENGTGTALTDGVIRATSELSPGDSVDVKRVELIGLYRSHEIAIDLGGAHTVDTVFLPNVRRGGNRYANVVSIEVMVDGAYQQVVFTENAVVAATVMAAEDPSSLMCRGEEDLPLDHQYYDVTLTFPVVKRVTNVRITFDTNFEGNNSSSIQHHSEIRNSDGHSKYVEITRAYVLAIEEIEIYNRSGEPDVSYDESYDDSSASEPAEITYTVTITGNEDGIYTVAAALPKGILHGTIVVSVSDKLTYVEGSLVPVVGGVPTPGYDYDGIKGQCVSFASAFAFDEGTVVFTAKYRAKDGAEITADDITVPYWHLGDGSQIISSSEMGDVIKIFSTHEHVYDNEKWSSDGKQHWRECTVCGEKTKAEEHTYDESGVNCTVCGMQIDASTTFTVKITDNGDGTYTVTAALPKGILAGKIVVSASDKLAYVEGSIVPISEGVPNPKYDHDGIKGQCVIFASDFHYEDGTVAFTAEYRAKDGAEITVDDITVSCWDLSSDGVEIIGSFETGDVIKVLVPHEHVYDSENWLNDETQHWHECACGEKADIADHVYDNDCDADCNVCGAVRKITHKYSEKWSGDEAQHWHECEVCGDKADAAGHVYDNDCDTDCNVCGAVRKITHKYSEKWNSDETRHWRECEVCGDKADAADHVYDGDFDADCNICGAVREIKALLGDPNGDGTINNIDASLTLQHDAGVASLDDAALAAADVNGDTLVNNIDASRILQLDAGIIAAF